MGPPRSSRQGSREEQLDAELRFDLEQRTADKVASGLSPGEARRQALAEFGGVDRVKEECRDGQWENRMDSVLRDFRFTLRSLARDGRFTLLALLALALGVGSATVV